MSLINQMLQDLDKRNSNAVQANESYAQLGLVTTPKNHGSRYWIAASFVMLSILIGVFIWSMVHKKASDDVEHSKGALAAPIIDPSSSSQASTVDTAKLDHLLVEANIPSHFQLSTQLASLSSSNNNAQDDQQMLTASKSNIVATDASSVSSSSAVSSAMTNSAIKKEQSDTLKVSPLVKEITSAQKAEAEYRQATQYHQQGRNGEALASLEQALLHEPKHLAARQLLISMYLEQNRHEEAMQQLKFGLQHEPEQVELTMMLARLYVEKNKQKEALTLMQKALPRGQEKPEFLAFLATLKQRDGQSAEAVELYRAALRKSPENSGWWMGMGIAFMSLGQSNSALEAFKQAKNFRNLSPELLAFVDQKILFLQQ
jgi:Flp pilus assembly protein TadD